MKQGKEVTARTYEVEGEGERLVKFESDIKK